MKGLKKCALCENMEDPRFGSTYRGVRWPLCDGCGGPENREQQQALAKRLDALPIKHSVGEEARIQHSLTRLRANIDNVDLALDLGGPAGDVAQVLVQTAVEVASQLWRRDAYQLVESEATELPSNSGVKP